MGRLAVGTAIGALSEEKHHASGTPAPFRRLGSQRRVGFPMVARRQKMSTLFSKNAKVGIWPERNSYSFLFGAQRVRFARSSVFTGCFAFGTIKAGNAHHECA